MHNIRVFKPVAPWSYNQRARCPYTYATRICDVTRAISNLFNWSSWQEKLDDDATAENEQITEGLDALRDLEEQRTRQRLQKPKGSNKVQVRWRCFLTRAHSGSYMGGTAKAFSPNPSQICFSLCAERDLLPVQMECCFEGTARQPSLAQKAMIVKPRSRIYWSINLVRKVFDSPLSTLKNNSCYSDLTPFKTKQTQKCRQANNLAKVIGDSDVNTLSKPL